MYIVFERDQCYPKYLIKYKLTKSLSHESTSQSASTLHYSTPYHVNAATGNQSTSRPSQANDKNICIIQ